MVCMDALVHQPAQPPLQPLPAKEGPPAGPKPQVSLRGVGCLLCRALRSPGALGGIAQGPCQQGVQRQGPQLHAER
eukprot:9805253-Lingulodinium_polyedra.AAC.1